VNFDGKIIMNEPNQMVLAPNGSGALFEALNNSPKAKEALNSVDYVQIITIDNALNKVMDPLMIGLTARNDLYLLMKACER
jgi:UDP-N-acetylglucosamine pyrophosphorylase